MKSSGHLAPQVQLGIGLIGVSLAVGLGVLLFSGNSQGATPPKVPSNGLLSNGQEPIVLEPGGQNYENVPLAGATISLPAGATWLQGPVASPGQPSFTGTSTPFSTGPLKSGQQVTTTLTWKDASGNTRSTDLTLSAGV